MADNDADICGMDCFVYKGTSNPDTYLLLPARDQFDAVPEALMKKLGPVEAVMEFELRPGKKLARVMAEEIMAAFSSHGYYLQLPPEDALRSGALLGYGE